MSNCLLVDTTVSWASVDIWELGIVESIYDVAFDTRPKLCAEICYMFITLLYPESKANIVFREMYEQFKKKYMDVFHTTARLSKTWHSKKKLKRYSAYFEKKLDEYKSYVLSSSATKKNWQCLQQEHMRIDKPIDTIEIEK